MHTSATFKQQASGRLRERFREFEYKGSGFHFWKASAEFYYVIGIQGSNYGDICYVEFGIHPKSIEAKKIKQYKYYNCMWRVRIGSQWPYASTPEGNKALADQIADSVLALAEPIVQTLTETPDIFTQISFISGKSIFRQFSALLNGFRPMTTEVKLVADLFELLRAQNSPKALEAARFGLTLTPSYNHEYKAFLEEQAGK